MTTFKQKILAKEIKRADAMKVRWEDLHEEPGFNLRIEDADFEASIVALADHIAGGGQYPALEVRPRAEGGVWIVGGHRRMRAIGIAIERGAPLADKEGEVWVPIVAFEGNDADRVARVITSAEGRALSPLEIAEGYKRLRGFGWDAARIAQKVGKTPQHVNQLLTLADASSDVHQAVAAGTVAAATAVGIIRQHGENAGKVIADAAAAAKAQGKKKVTAGTMQPKALPRNVADEAEQAILWFSREGLSGDSLETLALAQAHPERYRDVEVSVPVSSLLEITDVMVKILEARDKQAAKARDAAAKAAQTDIEDAA